MRSTSMAVANSFIPWYCLIFIVQKTEERFSLFNWLQVGYIVTSCLLNENHDFLRLAINTVRNDIIGRNETFQCLALTMVWQYLFSFQNILFILILKFYVIMIKRDLIFCVCLPELYDYMLCQYWIGLLIIFVVWSDFGISWIFHLDKLFFLFLFL